MHQFMICLTGLVALATHTIADVSLMHVWGFDGNGIDRIGGANAAPNPAANYAEDAASRTLGLGGYARFDRIGPNTDDLLVDSPINLGAGSFSIAFWVRRNEDGGSGDVVADSTVGPNGNGNDAPGLAINFSGDGNFTVLVAPGSPNNTFTAVAADPFINDRGWVHYAATVDRLNGSVALYIGGHQASVTDAPTLVSSTGGIVMPFLRFGSADSFRAGTSPSAGLGGDLGLFQIYNGVLLADDVAALAVPMPGVGLPMLAGVSLVGRRRRP